MTERLYETKLIKYRIKISATSAFWLPKVIGNQYAVKVLTFLYKYIIITYKNITYTIVQGFR